ncbi:AAA family ATPase [Streptococcus constellatus]|uniref:AAA family ATPase n=1 Tax=Streptococcus constellatus TaxID=76860 RepID=UPI0024200CDB|nr:AAA family ATPase [Streptococcus constellatus]
MKIDLSNVTLFDSNILEINKPVNFIFGKNGTGKSTISRLIKEQNPDKDVRIFHGVESVAIDGKLNSVILGQENILAQKNIEKLNKEIESLQYDKQAVVNEKSDIQNNIDGKENEKNEAERTIKNFLTKKASEIKNNPLHVATPQYNISSIKKELKYAFKLSEDEKQECKENIKIEERIAKDIPIVRINFKSLLDETNKLLNSAIEEEKDIIRLSSSPKINFAKTGFELHEKGDICSFCGNNIADDTFDELEKFFSASKIKDFENSINDLIKKIDSSTEIINNIVFDRNQFYSNYQKEIGDLKEQKDILVKEQYSFLSELKSKLETKLTQLFSKSELIELKIPDDISEILKNYSTLVKENNSEDFIRIKKFSKDLLRFDLIAIALLEFEHEHEGYANKLHSIAEIKKEIDVLEKNKKEKEAEELSIESKITDKKAEIQNEINKTKSEHILAKNINKKLEMYVNFELEHVEMKEDSRNGYYRIKNKEASETKYRDITTLSDGEKNIIGFLYFIEKLGEVQNNLSDKIIVFDDPMDSNDDMMQYIIITEIQDLMKPIDKKRVSDILVVMTHNSHFYINVKYNRLYKDGLDRNGAEKIGDNFIRLQKEGGVTRIKILDSEGQDFSTNYELLWKELRFLFDNDKPNLMLNSIRRIIETYTKFNKSDNFYGENKEAQKLFNVNSHSIDDLEAELNGKTKDQIIDLMRACFNSNNAKNHFKTHWNASKK